MKLRATAPGKMILLGEYAVLEGAPAVVAAVNRFAGCEFREHGQPFYRVSASVLSKDSVRFTISDDFRVIFSNDVSAADREALRFFSGAMEAVLHTRPGGSPQLPLGAFSLDTTDFYDPALRRKFGFGSSAALVSALTGLLHRLMGAEADSSDALFPEAFRVHKQVQGGAGSGADVAAAIYGGILRFQKRNDRPEPQVQPLRLPQQLHMTVVWSGTSASTTALVEAVQGLRANKPAQYAQLLEEMSCLSAAGIEALNRGDTGAFCDAVRAYHAHMEMLGQAAGVEIVSRPHRELAALANKFGAAYKPSGAGGGDVGIAFSDDPRALTALQKAWQKAGFYPLAVEITGQGLKITENEVV